MKKKNDYVIAKFSRYNIENQIQSTPLKILLDGTLCHLLNIEYDVNQAILQNKFKATLLSLFPETNIEKLHLDNIKNIVNKVFSGNKSISDDSIESMAYTMYKGDLSEADRTIEVYLFLIAFMYDFLIDKNFDTFRQEPKKIDEAFNIFLRILEGLYPTVDLIPSVQNIPKFSFICQTLLKIRQTLEEKQTDLSFFLNGAKDYHQSLLEKFNNKINNRKLNAKAYLNLAKNTYAAPMFCGMHIAFAKINLKKEIKNHPDFIKYQRRLYKALRIMGDLFSFVKDLNEKNLSRINTQNLNSSFGQAVDKYNQLFIKLLVLKKVLLMNNLRDVDSLNAIFAIFEKMLHGNMEWCIKTKRYQSEDCSLKARRIPVTLEVTLQNKIYKVIAHENQNLLQNTYKQNGLFGENGTNKNLQSEYSDRFGSKL